MMDEWNNDGSRIDPWPLHLKYSTENEFNEMLNRIDEVENGINDIKMWLNSLYLNGLVANPKDQDGVYTYLNSDTVFDYGSWVPKRK